MCGICGVIRPSGAPVDPAGVRLMLDALTHRGPDSWGLMEAPGVTAGIRRLRVIDLATGDQPISNEDGRVEVVFNGEIYNHRELRRDLVSRGHRFKTQADTEVLVHLWEERGLAMLAELDGMFAFCLADRRTGEVVLARDAMGIKPLFLRRIGEAIVFASETAALLRYPAPKPAIDPTRLVDLVALQYVPGRRTVWSGIDKLLPGRSIRVQGGAIRETRWFVLPEPAESAAPPVEALAEELRSRLDATVRAQSIADVPVGVFLSGGLDSTGIAGFLARHAPGRVQSFSVGFEDAPAHDDRDAALAASRAFGTDHHELVVSAGDVARLLPEAIAHLEEPVLDPALLPTWLLSRFAHREVTVALSGEGADELFGGYRRHLLQQRLGWVRALPGLAPVARVGRRMGWIPHRVGQALEALATTDPVRNHLEWSQTIARSLAGSLFDEDLVRTFERDSTAAFAPYFERDPDGLSARLAADLAEWLPHDLLAKVDRASMAFSLEARVPYLGREVVSFVTRLPDAVKIRGGETKVLLRRALAGVVPEAILTRPKRGFDLPLGAWLRGPLRELALRRLDERALRGWPGLKGVEVASLLARHLSGAQDFGLPLFNLLSVGLFLERHGLA
jgi:asparagine synthase (glutamine-hydrolysing)